MFFTGKKRRAKRYLGILGISVLLAQTLFPGIAWAGEEKQAEKQAAAAQAQAQAAGISAQVSGGVQVSPAVQADSGQPLKEPAVSLEKAIGIVKDNFTIPPEYTKFTSGLNMYNQTQSWSLNWNSPEQPGGNFSAQVDTDTGEIINMNNWKNEYKPGPTVQIPAIQESDARNSALELVTRLAGNKLSDLQLLPMDDNIIPLSGYGPVSYTVRWQRLVNGIPFPNNGVTVQVNSLTGEIQNYSLNWQPLTQIPDAKGAIPESKAEESFLNSSILELQYFTPSLMRPLNTGEKQDVKLVYQMSGTDPSGALDALTGEPLKLNYGGYYGSGGGGGGDAGFTSGNVPAQKAVITPAEQSEIDKTANLLSQDQAVAAVKRWVSIPDDLVLRGYNLSTDGMSGEKRVWDLNWSGNGGKADEPPQYMYARVDASTGELLSFNQPYTGQGSDKPVLDRSQAQTVAEDFLKQIQPSHFLEVKLAEENYPAGKGVPNNGPQGFNYYRVVNGIPYRGNGINVTVDTVSKEIISYNLNWADLDFPAPSGILDGKQAGEALLKAEPLKLMYTQVYDPSLYDQPGKVQLVYQPASADGNTAYNILDAQTGDFLDMQGQPLSQARKAYHFTDIENSFAQKEIALLGQAGIFGEYQSLFKPDEQITVGSLLKAMLAVQNGYGVPLPASQSDADLIKTAQQQGWLTEDLSPSATITREDFTKLMLRYLKLEKVAQLPGIYQAPYTDVDEGFAGYAALAQGIGMFKLEGSGFDPGHVMTRAEAAYAFVKALMF